MYLSKFKLFNYKSFQDSGLLEFTPGINIIVGQNNAGKTALLEALTLNFSDVPHRSIKTLNNPLSTLGNIQSKSQVSLYLDKKELRLILAQGLLPFVIPVVKDDLKNQDYNFNDTIEQLDRSLNKDDSVEFIVSLYGSNIIDIPNTDLPFILYSNLTDVISARNGEDIYVPTGSRNSENMYHCIDIKLTVDGKLDINIDLHTTLSDTILIKLFKLFQSRIYRFYAERLNISRCAFGNKSILQPKDLAVSLSSCGTGIGQVLAILYVVMNSPEPRTIIIDEPQSFLHPGAAKKLIEILKQFPQHQYFIATHSPTIINAANPSKIIMLKYEDCETKVSAINAKEAREQRSLLAEVGVSLSDVFGADNILWVEGPTEQICFPLILEKLAEKSLLGTTILAVQDVGRLDNKNASLIFDIYDKLSGGSSLFPPAIGFLFDRENRSNNDEKELQKRSKKPIKLLPRRMYENYLLHPEAITAVINECDENREEKLTIEEVKEWIDKNKYEASYFPKTVKIEEISDNDWFCKVDGAKLLKELFAHFCETRLPFSKTTHSVKLTEWLIDNQPEQLLEIAGLLVNILDFKD